MVLISEKTENNKVPDVRNMGAKDAVYLLESRGLKVRIEGVGRVVAQSLAPETKIVKGQTISIKLKKGGK